MENDTKKFIIAIFAVGIFIGSIIGGIYVYSGVSPPFTVINSGSMQHSDESSIGTIDTGDMVIVKNPDYQEITTYVEGSKTDYSKFGEYGDVIIYRSGDRNIIHRAMLHMTLYETETVTQKWYIPELKDYDNWDIKSILGSVKSLYWDNENCILTVDISSTFYLTDVGYGDGEPSVNIFKLGIGKDVGYSGYLTKGDNAETNKTFDQNSSIHPELVTEEDIRSIAAVEIPWLGCIKLWINDKNTDLIPENSITSLITVFVVLISIIIVLFAVSWYLDKKDERK